MPFEHATPLTPVFPLSELQSLNPLHDKGPPGLPQYDVALDGRFLMLKESQTQSAPTQVNVVLNWFEELKSKSPAGLKR